MADLCPWLRLEGLALDGRTPMFVRRDGSTPPLFELSSAEQVAVLLAADVHRHDHVSAIALIDRVDLHADPDDQLRWLQTLQTRSGGQVIATSTSERLAREIPNEQRVTLTRS